MTVSDMTGQRRQTLPREVTSTKHPSLPTMLVLMMTYNLKNNNIDPYMSIDTPSDEFYTINTNQSSPPMSARHKLQPRLLRSNRSPNTFPQKQTKQEWTCPIYLQGHIYKLSSQETKDSLQNIEAVQKFKIHKTILHHPMKMMNSKI